MQLQEQQLDCYSNFYAWIYDLFRDRTYTVEAEAVASFHGEHILRQFPVQKVSRPWAAVVAMESPFKNLTERFGAV